jgi:hypothetical protein
MKYGIRGTEGIAIGVYTLIINLMITGLCGLYYTYTKHIFFSGWTFLSLLFIASPIIVWLLDQILDRVVLKSFSLLNNIKKLISSISHSSQKLLMDYKTSIVMFLFTVASLIVFIFLLFWITIVFNIHTGLDKIIMFALMMRLSTLVRLVPGNLGVQELFSGGVFYVIGGSLNDGMAIALFVRFLSIVLAFTIGTIGIAVNLSHFKLGGLKKMWAELTKSNYPDAVSDDGINSS